MPGNSGEPDSCGEEASPAGTNVTPEVDGDRIIHGEDESGSLASGQGAAMATAIQRLLGDAIHIQAMGGSRKECRAFCRRGLANFEQFSADELALASRLLAAAIEASFLQLEEDLPAGESS